MIGASTSPTSQTTYEPLPPRVQIVARNYWPICDEPSLRLMHTLDAWNSIGIVPKVLTTRWNSQWPDRAFLRSVLVERLLPAQTSSWNESHFQRNVTKWLVQHADSYDALYVDASDPLLAAIVAKIKPIGKPILARFCLDQSPVAKPRALSSYLPSTPPIADSLRKCSAVIADHRRAYQSLLDLGVSKERSTWIPDAVFAPAERSESLRRSAAHALFQISGDLAIPTQTALMMHFGETTMSQIQVVLQSVCDLLERGIPVRMWLIHPGPDAPKIYEWLRLRGWHHDVLIFDGFDVLDDLICVADLAIVSNPACSLQYSTRMVLESQLPMIVAVDPALSDWMPETPLMKWYYSRESLGNQLADFLTHREQWQAEAESLQRHYQRHEPKEHWLDRWRSIFTEVTLPNLSAVAPKRSP